MASYGTTEELYAEFSQLKQFSGFSDEWHAKYSEITAKVPYPERKFGKRYRPGALGEQAVDIRGQRSSKRMKSEPAAPIVPAAGSRAGRSPPAYLRDELSEQTEADVTTEPWLHELSETPVFRLKIEYLNRIVHLEKQLAQYSRGKKAPGRTRSSDNARQMGDTSSPRRQLRCTAGTTAGGAEEADDDDDDDGDAGSGSGNPAVQHPAAGQSSGTSSTSATVVLEDGDEETEDFLLQEETD